MEALEHSRAARNKTMRDFWIVVGMLRVDQLAVLSLAHILIAQRVSHRVLIPGFDFDDGLGSRRWAARSRSGA